MPCPSEIKLGGKFCEKKKSIGCFFINDEFVVLFLNA